MRNFKFTSSTVLILAMVCSVLSLRANAQTVDNFDYVAFPPTTAESAVPLVMLTMSRDHQYFFKAYSDFSDLDPENNDGAETTYKNTYEYYGYFDPSKCYNYDGTLNRYVPEAYQNTAYYCDDVDGDWSGNFLNWSTMTRMDIVRKIFYGGFRSIDSNTVTVLERAHLPTDAHSFAKYYNGADIPRLTPFTSADVNWNGDGTTTDVNGNARTDRLDVDDRVEGITICNTTFDVSGQTSQGSAAPPLMRVVRGNFQLWAANERWQCTWSNENGNRSNGNTVARALLSGIDANSNDPNRTNDSLPAGTDVDRIVRVEVCNDSLLIETLRNGANCTEYPNGNFKPTGILHDFGERGLIQFGLMTGGFEANTEGGVLRRNISDFRDEVNENTSGTFNTSLSGIVSNLNALRIYGYAYRDGTYRTSGGAGDDCDFQLTDISTSPRQCFSWGNPISEIVKESINYLTGGTATPAFNQDDSGRLPGVISPTTGLRIVPGLSVEAWVDPITADNQCSDVTQIVINASVSSFDDDNVALGATFPGSPNVDAFTDAVGVFEGITGNDFFIGVTAADANEFCTSKTVGSFSGISGICPEAPTVDGTYAMVGMAHYAKTTDLRAFDGDQTIETLGITLATNLPTIEVPLGATDTATDSINILPAYRLLTADEGGGALVDFKIVQPHTEVAATPGTFEGKYYVNWEDSEQGGDFDNDVWGTISYLLNTNVSPATIEITTNAIFQSTINGQLFGFITSGTTQDGFHAYSGVIDADYTDPIAGVPGCNNCRALNQGGGGQRGEQSHVFTINTATPSAELLETPLYYAAKYGSFDDENGNDRPDLPVEFDKVNNFTGEETPDGIPDGYFAATSPQTLVQSIENALLAVLANTESSGTAPANLANADGSGGLIVQALYFETFDGDDPLRPGESVEWTGELQTFFIDENGFFREDGNGNGQLDGSDVDNAFTYSFDEAAQALNIQRFRLQNESLPFNNSVPTTDAAYNPLVTIGGEVDARDLNVLWSASDNLSALNNDLLETNRTYSSAVNTTEASRYVFTWVDKNGNGEVDTGEEIEFVRDNVRDVVGGNFIFPGQMGFLSGSSAQRVQRAQDVVDFIRGKEGIAGLRSRQIPEDGSDVVKRLGDIVNATPVIVGAPTETFDTVFGDSTYRQFREKYSNRRNVIYVGGNDGLIHAFNAGFREFSTTSSVIFSETRPTGGGAAHPLGAEIWAYAPFNLMPHYQWLSQPTYTHVFYMDGEPATYDVNIFPDDDTHPGGWGTILVMGMRLGGGEYDLGFGPSGFGGDPADNILTRSSYVVLDVTDPEQPPKLLAEINHPDLFHTVSKPVVVKKRIPGVGFDFNNTTTNDWQLVFGTGPESRISFSTTNNAAVFTVDLDLNTSGVIDNPEPTKFDIADESANSFVGNLVSTDWNNDFTDDVVYFGTVQQVTTGDNQSGALFRFLANETTPDVNLLMDVNRPVSSAPLTQRVQQQNFVYAGTGRFLHQPDTDTSSEEVYVGIKEENSGYTATFNAGDLLNVSDVRVFQITDTATGAVTGNEVTDLPTGVPAEVDTFEELQQYILTTSSVQGWSRFFRVDGTNPAERVSVNSVAVRTQLLFNTFTPEDNICSPVDGNSDLYAVDLITGTASSFGALGFQTPTSSGGSSSAEANTSTSLGAGRASSPSAFIGAGGGGNTGNVISQSTTGKLNNTELLLGAPIDLKRVNWREIIQ